MRLEVCGVSFSHNSHPVLTDVGFSVEPGELVCIMGVNGAGKSTLLRCLNRVLTPSGGAVLMDGEDLSFMSRKKIAQKVGYVPQRRQDSSSSVFETVLMGRRPHIRWAVSDDDYALVERIIGELGLAHLAMRPVDTLSGGESQKVAIARALAQSPQVLLLDEPTSNLDLGGQLEVMGLVRRIVRSRELAAAIAIHDLNVAVRFADRFIFLKEHRIRAVTDGNGLSAEIIHDVYGVEVQLTRVCGHTVVVPT